MDNTNYITIAKQTSLWRQMDMIANNLANAETMSYKAERPLFTEYLERIGGQRALSFSQDLGAIRDLEDGPVVKTGNQFDLAIHGDAYFVMRTDRGMRYSRNGHFMLNAERELVNTAGDPVMNINDRPIQLPATETTVAIAPDGTISGQLGQIDRIRMVAFDAPRQMQREADSLYQTDQTPTDPREAQLIQGMLERSNVKPIMELTNLISVHRSYQANAKLIETDTDLQRKIIDRIMKA